VSPFVLGCQEETLFYINKIKGLYFDKEIMYDFDVIPSLFIRKKLFTVKYPKKNSKK